MRHVCAAKSPRERQCHQGIDTQLLANPPALSLGKLTRQPRFKIQVQTIAQYTS